MEKRGAASNDLDLDICYEGHPLEKVFLDGRLFVKKLLTKKFIK